MRLSIVVGTILSTCGSLAVADAAPLHRAHVSACVARQRADLAPLDRYGGVLPANAPGLMQQIMKPYLANLRVHCMPVNPNAPDIWWHDGSATISP